MADKINTGNIYTDPVGNNLVVVDPNKVVIGGQVKDRLVAHEDLVMYVNLTAKIFPRSKIISGIGDGDKVVVDIFEGDLNFLKPKGTNKLNSDWTEGFTNPEINKKLINEDDEVIGTQNEKDIQGFGITSISIKVDSSYIPSVQINFTDVRGKTLFEQARTNTPYTAFFHLPYPTFFLVVKGYYGKAVKYQLTLTKFVSRFDPASGDYLVTCDFIGNHIALLRDVNMHQSLTAPYMYPSQASPDGTKVTATKGMDILAEVYALYVKKGLVSENFPRDMTIVSLLDTLNKLENDLGKLFGEANLAATTDKLQYGEDLDDFKKELWWSKTSWKNTYLDVARAKTVTTVVPSETIVTGATKNVSVYPLKNIPTDASQPNYQADVVKSWDTAANALDKILIKYHKLLIDNATFGQAGDYKVTFQFPNPKDYPQLMLSQSTVNSDLGPEVKDTSKLDNTRGEYFMIDAFEKTIMKLWLKQKKEFDGGPESQAKLMAKEITDVLNTRLEKEIGFKPTIRNVFAVIISGADTFLRLMDDVHTKAMKNSKNEKRISVSKESNDTKKTDVVFPWPQYSVVKEEKECCTSSVVTYLGANDAIDTTEGNNKEIWPEVEFVEEYTKTSVYKSVDFNFNGASSSGVRQYTPITARDWGTGAGPYTEYTDYTTLLFEILNRAQEAVRYGSLATRYMQSTSTLIGESINEISEYDANNLYNVIKEFSNMKELFSKINNIDDITEILKKSDESTYLLYDLEDVVLPIYNRKTYEYSYVGQAYTVISEDFPTSSDALKLDKSTPGLFDLVPTRYGNWVRQNFAGAYTASSADFYRIDKNLEYNISDTDVLRDTPDTRYYTDSLYCASGPIAGLGAKLRLDGRYPLMSNLTNKNLVDDYYKDIISNKLVLTEGILKATSGTTGTGAPADPVVISEGNERITSMLNTPYFINSLLKGVTNEQSGVKEAYKEAAYLFLNSLPLPTFRERVLVGDGNNGEEFGAYMSELFNQIPALHDVPVSLLMRVGSIWWRYKETVINGPSSDPILSIWDNIGGSGTTGPAHVYDPIGQSIERLYNYNDNGITWDFRAAFSADTTASPIRPTNIMNVGVYPSIIKAMHYIATGVQVPVPPLILNNIVDAGAGTAPLNIKVNSQLTVDKDKDTAPEPSGTTIVNFYDVWLDSKNIINEDLGVKFVNKEKPNRYYILYPSSGGLTNTDVGGQPETTTLFNNNAIHNGASRLIWGLSNYGYMQHKPGYLPLSNSYTKKIKASATTQDSWRFSENGDYSTIQELRGVFNKEQLDFFEQLFLSFSNPTGSTEVSIGATDTFKKIIKEIMVIEESWLHPHEIADELNGPINLSVAQTRKFFDVVHKFINSKITYAHRSTTNLDSVIDNATLMQRLRAIINQNNEYDFGKYSATTVPIPAAGNNFVGNPTVYQDMRIYVGEFYNSAVSELNHLVPADDSNIMYSFFKTATVGGVAGAGIEFNSANIKAFAPIIRLYASNPQTPNPSNSGYKFISDFLGTFDTGFARKEKEYVNNLVKKLNSNIIKGQKVKKSKNEDDFIDNRTSIEGDDLKLELYGQFKNINDRWISGISLKQETLFEKFLFFDRANRDIGDDAYVNIWDILTLDSPFAPGNDKTLTQSVDSFINTILANNGFNFIALPSYINFYQVGGDNAQVQGNSMFGTFDTVDYLESAPAFLCQYIGKKSDQLDVKTQNNGFANDTYPLNKTTPNPLLGCSCPQDKGKDKSSKVMGFTVDFGIPNQNVFESITLDQAQYQNTSESYKILQEIADSGGGNATSMASASLYNVYASRSYTASITCVGNVTIQPTQYFQIRYLPMFNGPYLIINVSHNITPNTIETTFDGVRVPIAKLPDINDLVLRLNEKLFQEAESRLKEQREDVYLDDINATPKQLKLTANDTNYYDSGTTESDLSDDTMRVGFYDPVDPAFVNVPEDHPTRVHLGLDLQIKPEYEDEAAEGGIPIYPIMKGTVTKIVDFCDPQDTKEACGRYGNYIETTMSLNPAATIENETVEYKVIYGFLRKDISVGYNESFAMNELGYENGKSIAQLGNSGPSKSPHLHLEIRRKVIKNGKPVWHILNPKNFLPSFSS